MIWWLIIGVVMIMVMLAMFIIFSDEIMRYIGNNDRIKKVSKNAKDNVRINDRTNNKRYRPLEIEPLGDNLYKVVGEETTSPFERVTWRLYPFQLRQNPIHTLLDGVTDLWLVQENHFITHQAEVQQEATSTSNPDGTVQTQPQAQVQPAPNPQSQQPQSAGVMEQVNYNNAHPMYSPKELNAMVEHQKRQITEQRGVINQQQANKRREVEDMVAHVSQMSQSKSAGGGFKR